jgi:hypothetical protein
VGRTEPDLHLIKQVEQVTTSALKGRACTSPGFRARESQTPRSPRISDLAITASAVIWLQKQPGEDEGDLVAKGQSDNATGPNRRFHEPGHMGCRAVALPNSVRLIRNRGNLACCPDFALAVRIRRGSSSATSLCFRTCRNQLVARRMAQGLTSIDGGRMAGHREAR